MLLRQMNSAERKRELEEAEAMAESSETLESKESLISKEPESNTKTSEVSEKEDDEFDPKTRRKTKPGIKRLTLIVAVLFSFIAGLPFLLKSIEIYRSPLPFREIDTLTKSFESSTLNIPCRFQVVYLGFSQKESDDHQSHVEKLGFLISDQMRKLIGNGTVCGGCGNNYTVSVTMESGGDCVRNSNSGTACLWQCGSVDNSRLKDDDEASDELLDSALHGVDGCSDLGGKVYTVVVINKDEETRTVVGKHRHAWIAGKVTEMDAVPMIANVFVKFFMNGGKGGLVQGEFMPVGADGKVVLSFSLLNADPQDWIYDWDFKKLSEIFVAPVVKALEVVANISVESQVLYHTPKSSFSFWDEKLSSFVFSTKDLPFFVNSNEWHLDTSIAAGGRSKILHFVACLGFFLTAETIFPKVEKNSFKSTTVQVMRLWNYVLDPVAGKPSPIRYIPSAGECPLVLQLPNEQISMTNGFVSPMWGGVIVWNPSNCLRDSNSRHPVRHTLSPQDLQKVFEVFIGQLRQLFGLHSDNHLTAPSGVSSFLTSERGFTEWELDALSRHYTCSNLISCVTTLGSLSKLVQSLPRMIIKDEIGKQVKVSLEAAWLAQYNASLGVYDSSTVSSRQARALAEDAFFHPSIMSISYYSFEHCFAVYTPFFLPVSLHILFAAIKEVKRYKHERTKYFAWKAKAKLKS